MRSVCDHALKKLIFAVKCLCRELNRSTNAFAVFSGFHHFLSLITHVSSIKSSDCLRISFEEACQNRWMYEYREAYNVQYFDFFMNSSWFKNSFDFRTRDNGVQNSDLKSVKLNVVIGANESSSAPYSWRQSIILFIKTSWRIRHNVWSICDRRSSDILFCSQYSKQRNNFFDQSLNSIFLIHFIQSFFCIFGWLECCVSSLENGLK